MTSAIETPQGILLSQKM